MAIKLSLILLLVIALSSCGKQPQSAPEAPAPDALSWLPPEPCEPLPCGPGLYEPFKGVPGMENVIQASPPPYPYTPYLLINAATDTEVTVYYRKPIATRDTELVTAIIVRDEEGNLVPGTLSISADRAFLRFCAAEAYRPGGRYFVSYQAVEFKDSSKAKAFNTEFQVESDEKNITLGAKPCDFLYSQPPLPVEFQDTVLRTP